MSRYGEVTLVGGPLDGATVPTLGRPLYGFCFELDYDEPSWDRKRTRVAIYKTVEVSPARAHYLGTLR